jgi:hypothetical protein
MTIQKTPHTQTQQNTTPEQTDMQPNENTQQGGSSSEEDIYTRMEGAETGGNRSPRHATTGGSGHNTEPETEAHEGPLDTRTPKRPAQGITSRSSEEESARQEKVVNERPDAQGGVNHSR